MIKNTRKAITDYTEAYTQAKDVYIQAVKYIKANYKNGSEVYKSAMKSAKETFEKALTPMRDICKEKVQKDFNEVRKAISKAVAVLPSDKVLGILPMIKSGKITETETQMFLEEFKGNYMDVKLLNDAMGKHFKTVESIMDELEMIENATNEYIDTFAGETLANMSDNNIMLLKGSYIEDVDSLTDDFVNMYSSQENE